MGLRRHELDALEWESGGFSFELQPRDESVGTDGLQFQLDASTCLVTTGEGGATVREHYRAQRWVALTLFGGHLVREDVQHEETASGV